MTSLNPGIASVERILWDTIRYIERQSDKPLRFWGLWGIRFPGAGGFQPTSSDILVRIQTQDLHGSVNMTWASLRNASKRTHRFSRLTQHTDPLRF